MKIAQIAPIAERVPPKKYGGTERVVYCLTEELIKKGHDVTLFATADSITSAKLQSVFPKGLREAKVKDPHGINPWTILHIGTAYAQVENFDIIHDHNSPISLPAANISETPVVMTIHSPLTIENQKLFSVMRKPNLVSISHNQIREATGLNFVGTVHNGLNFDNYPFSEKPEDYLLFIGRASEEKGLHLAIEVAEQLNMTLLIGAKVDEVDKDYFKNEIAPRLSRKIVWVGEVDEEEKIRLLSQAKAFLHPVTWPEPFGLTIVEAMATGTPVIAMNKGSIPELIDNGVSGFVADSIESMIESILEIDKIDRRKVREHSLTNFNSHLMADNYERIYQQILSQQNIYPTKAQGQLPLLLGTSTSNSAKVGNGSRYSGFRKR